MLFDPSSHEPMTDRPWDSGRARDAIAAVVAETESAFDDALLWPALPIDEEEGPLAAASLYEGAAGVIWALHRLQTGGNAALRRNWAPVAVGLIERYLSQPELQVFVDRPVPSLWMGEAGILLVAHTLAPATWQEERLLDAVRANAANPSCELMWGSPGTMIAAQVLYRRTGAHRWREAWHESADLLLAAWRDDLWLQDLFGSRVHYLGPAHGFAGNILALTQGDLLGPVRRAELEQRAIAVTEKYSHQANGLCQWPPGTFEPREPQKIRTQWCHGAPGMVASLASLAPHDEQLTQLLIAGGELTWQAGPLKKGANLCHGTAGNGYAFLKLFERTGDEGWLDRARGFAMHAVEQIEQARAKYGRGRHTLWTGDLGTALYLDDCLSSTTAFPTLDHF
jgi:lantibiotic modifying enzyme